MLRKNEKHVQVQNEENRVEGACAKFRVPRAGCRCRVPGSMCRVLGAGAGAGWWKQVPV